jgi:MbtH protein
MTSLEPAADGIDYHVVVNDEEQFSIWRADSPPPPGWRIAGPTGDIQACLEYIRLEWTDMRPLSLRRALAEGRE